MKHFKVIWVIILSIVTLLTMSGKATIPVAYANQNPLLASPKPTPYPHFASGESTVCTEIDLGYYPKSLTIAKERERGLITPEIVSERTDGVIEPTATPILSPVIQLASAQDVTTASASAGQTDTPTQAPQTSGSELSAEVLFSLVNQTRTNAGLVPFETNPDVCSVAQSRGPELDNEIYGTSSMHAGFRGRNLPYWATENMISQHTEQAALNWWMNSPVHRSAIMGDYTYACTVCQGKSCAMIFSNLTPKTN